MIEYDGIRARLLATSAVTDIVGGTSHARIYPLRLPQRGKLPAITYQRIDGEREHAMEGTSGLARIRVQLDCWATDQAGRDGYTTVKQLAAAVRGALDGWRGAQGSESIKGAFLIGDRDLHESGFFRVSMDFGIWYDESLG